MPYAIRSIDLDSAIGDCVIALLAALFIYRYQLGAENAETSFLIGNAQDCYQYGGALGDAWARSRHLRGIPGMHDKISIILARLQKIHEEVACLRPAQLSEPLILRFKPKRAHPRQRGVRILIVIEKRHVQEVQRAGQDFRVPSPGQLAKRLLQSMRRPPGIVEDVETRRAIWTIFRILDQFDEIVVATCGWPALRQATQSA